MSYQRCVADHRTGLELLELRVAKVEQFTRESASRTAPYCGASDRRAKVSYRLYLMTRLLVNAEVDRRPGPVLQCDLSNSVIRSNSIAYRDRDWRSNSDSLNPQRCHLWSSPTPPQRYLRKTSTSAPRRCGRIRPPCTPSYARAPPAGLTATGDSG